MPGVLPLETPFITGTEPPAEPLPVVPAWRQQEVLQPGRYMLRHMGPLSTEAGEDGIINPLGAGIAVLAQTLYAEPLPISRLPNSPDFHEGNYTLRLLDAGEFTVTFPNKDSSDGRPWRNRFSAIGHNEWIEISREAEIEMIGCIVKIQKDRQKVTLTGYDGMFLLRKAFEQDWVGVMGPRDLIERYSGLNVLTVGDHPPTVATWALSTSGGSASAAFVSKGFTLTVVDTAAHQEATAVGPVFARGLTPWSLRVELEINSVCGRAGFVRLFAFSASGNSAELAVANQQAVVSITGGVSQTVPFVFKPGSTRHTMLLECDGRWVYGYIDGQLIGVVGGYAPGVEPKAVVIVDSASALEEGETTQVTVLEVVAKDRKPFLMRGSEKGDVVLPGSASTYPTGGLHARYVVHGPTTSAEAWWENALSPDPRRDGFPDFIEAQSPVRNETTADLPPGVPATYYAARFFGAIYLPLSKGDIAMNAPASDGVRVWIGDTSWWPGTGHGTGTSNWSAGVWRNNAFTAVASAMGGKDGWYPIIIEHFIVAGNGNHCELYLTPGATYTDPGGTVIKSGETIHVPITSLSPLGCVDARIQGSSFFDIVQSTAKDFGYQLRAEYRQLESGLFPAALIPKARVGIETDEVIEPDDRDSRSGINNYSVTEDSTDSVGSLKAFGSGIADGKGSQIAFEALSIPDEKSSLFDMQGWLSAGDIAFPAMLAARAEAERNVRSGAWQNVEGEPLGRDRLADTFPLTGVLSLFRWRPGDGVRLQLPDVGVYDTVPRQMLQIARNFNAEGRTGCQVGFRSRPKDPLVSLRGALRDATRPNRAYQRQYASRFSQPAAGASMGAGVYTNYALISLLPAEQIIDARFVIAVNASSLGTSIEINNVDRTTALGGPWFGPVSIPIFTFAVPNIPGTDNRLFMRLKNIAGTQAFIEGYLQVTLLV